MSQVSRILIVDDDPVSIKLLQKALAKQQGPSTPRADHPWRRPMRSAAATDARCPTDPAA